MRQHHVKVTFEAEVKANVQRLRNAGRWSVRFDGHVIYPTSVKVTLAGDADLTPGRQRVLDALAYFECKGQMSVTLDELADHLGRVKSTVQQHVVALERSRHIGRNHKGRIYVLARS